MGDAVSVRKWLQNLLRGSQRKRSHRKTTNTTQTLTLDAPITPQSTRLLEKMPTLTPREKEIVQLIRKGYSNKEIAKELGIAVTTVKWNITHILAKFEVESSKQLIVLLAAQDADHLRDWMLIG